MIELQSNVEAEFVAQWQSLAGAGSWWTARERNHIASTARSAHRHQNKPQTSDLAAVATEAATMVATAANTIRAVTVERFEHEGLGPLAYVELVGIVARTTAVDTAALGLGLPLRPYLDSGKNLDSGEDLKPNQQVGEARKRSAWVPMVGAAGATTALSAVPSRSPSPREPAWRVVSLL